MELEQIIELISEFGIMIVIAGIFLYTSIRLINLFLKHVEGRLRDRNHDKALEVRHNVNAKVQSLIQQFLEDMDGDRVHVVEFSNSVTSVAYLPFKYMNCTYEVYAVGNSPTSSKIDRLSTSLFTSFLSHLYDAPYCVLSVNDHNPEYGGAIYDLMENSGETYQLCAILKTARGKSLGFVSLKKETEFTQYELDSIQILADKLSALLGIMDR